MTVTTQTRAPWSQLRLRQSAHMRDLVAETTFSVAQLIQPLFVVEGHDRRASGARTGRHRASERVGSCSNRSRRDLDAGVRHFLLFAVPASKRGHALSFDHARRATAAIKERFGDALSLWVDICLCSSTEHGHCALLDRDGRIDLGPTLDALAQMAVEVADAGADGVSPSDMMDGRTAHLRAALDERGHERVPVMSYSTKFASQFYGRSARRPGRRRSSATAGTTRSTCARGAMRSPRACAVREEGADLLMVKPGMTSIDLIGPIAEATGRPVGAYQVSGEYAGLLALAAQGLTKFDAALLETWHVFRRAGAAYIITYGAQATRKSGWVVTQGLGLRPCSSARCASRPAACTVRCARFEASAARRFSSSAAPARVCIDVDGRAYIDFCQSFGPLILGHADPDVAQGVHEAVNDGWSFGACEPYSLSSQNGSPSACPGSSASASSPRAPKR